jgi:UDP-glucose 4-epimerase
LKYQTILVTGGAGFIGSNLVHKLIEDNNKLIVLDSLHRGSIQNLKEYIDSKKIILIKGDIRNQHDINKIGKVDIIYHLAAQSNVMGSVSDPDYSFSTNVDGTYNILKFASESNVKKFIFASSREVYGNAQYIPVDEKHQLKPLNMYGTTKLAGEILCRHFQNRGMDIIILRISNTYGPGDKDRVIPIFLENIKNKKDLVLYGGNQVLDFIWVEDVVNSIIEISQNDKYSGETLNIGTGIGTSIVDLAKKILKITHSNCKIMRKEQRDIETKKFISKSSKIKIKTLGLDEGLRKIAERIMG